MEGSQHIYTSDPDIEGSSSVMPRQYEALGLKRAIPIVTQLCCVKPWYPFLAVVYILASLILHNVLILGSTNKKYNNEKTRLAFRGTLRKLDYSK